MKSNKDLRQAIYKTLIYSGIFKYPLTEQEILYWLPISIKSDVKILNILLKSDKHIKNYQGYFWIKLKNDETQLLSKLVSQRRKRAKHSNNKLIIANQVAKWLRLIPSIKLVAITGTLAINQADEDDDIDLMIVTETGTLWTTRILYLLLLQFLGVRRKALDSMLTVKDKICPNLLIDENYLKMPKNKHDLYYAHEIMQAELLWDRQKTYMKFINDNAWIRKILPNSWNSKQKSMTDSAFYPGLDYPELIRNILCRLMRIVEPISCNLQLRYMDSKRTIETVTAYTAQFYPVNYHDKTMSEYNHNLTQVNLSK